MSRPRPHLNARAAELVNDKITNAALDDIPIEQLVDAIRRLEVNRATVQTVAGRLIAEALARGYTIRDLSQRTDIPRSTLDRWAAPFKTGQP